MDIRDFFPIWDQLDQKHQTVIADSLIQRNVKKGEIIHNGNLDCTGLLLVQKGQLRAYILSEEGREITIYRLFDRDLCMFAAPCMMKSIQFEITIEAEKDSDIWIIPPYVYQSVMKESAPIANYTSEIMATRMTEIMWLMEQIMWKSLDKRLAAFLLEEASIEGTGVLKTTHENIANHLGSHREVITRMLKYFQNEGMVKLSRGTIELTDEDHLQRLCDA